ncbi:MAG: YncE family protein [Vicingaceae bacterium]|nr:YncE family protein [Vicingaceae bacterium]
MRLLYVTLLSISLFSCKKEELGPQCINCSNDSIESEAADVLILNEGNFGWGNGSISYYQPHTKTVSDNVYKQANNNIPLGDVVQSACQFNNKIYVVANNSSKVEVVNSSNFSNIASISGFNSPRYFLPVSYSKAYVSDLYSNSIQVVDLTNNTITGSINTNGWTEQLLLYNDTVYACDMSNDNLLIINPSNNTLVDSVKLGVEPNSITKDKNDKLWIMCGGGFQEDNAKLIRFNPQTRTIEATFIFSNINQSPSSLIMDNEKEQLYFLNNNVYKMDISATSLPSSVLINNNSNTFYGLGVDPINEDIYVADAIDYVQSGIVFRYSSSGSLIHQFNVGIIPGKFLFIE